MGRKTALSEAEEKAARQKASIDFSVARAGAINAYAEFELYLAQLFETLLGSEPQKAFAVFASVRDSRARLSMIETLLRISYGEKYNVFFCSLSNKLQGLDAMRNRLAHWIVMQQTTGGKPFNPRIDIFLSEHPNIFAEGRMFVNDVEYFSKQAGFYGLLIFNFSIYLRAPSAFQVQPNRRTWHDIFLEEVSYPPPEDHPLHRSRKRP
jgi:hypothetical protein